MMLPTRLPAIAVILAIGLLAGQCGKSDGPTQTSTTGNNHVDTIPPAAITDLLAKNPTYNSIFLLWTAPGDDGTEGTADSYDIRYHSEQITNLNWDKATQFDGEPAPSPAGSIETICIGGLDEITTYFFAVKTTDDEGHTSGLSNPAFGITLNENMPPAPVSDLSAVAVDEYSFLLTWTAPGDDGIVGTASEYEIRYSRKQITEETWESASAANLPPVPKCAGEPESLLVTIMRAPGNHYFALKTADEVPNWSGMSNVAFGMGYNVELMLSDNDIQIGEELRIIFRAPGDQLVTINLNQYGVMGCDPTHVWVKDCIVPSVRYSQGIYEIIYDFKTKDGNYLPAATYYVVLCWNFEIRTMGIVQYQNPP